MSELPDAGPAAAGPDSAAHRIDDPDPALVPNPNRVTRLAAYGLIERDGRVLLTRVGPGSLGAGRWTLPGGGLDFGEKPEHAAVREVEEETGFRVRIVGPPTIHSDTGIWPLARGDVEYHHVRFVYPMTIEGGVERVEVGGSTDAYAWFERSEIEGLLRGDLVDRVLDAGG